MEPIELTPGLWQWSAAHPEWTPDRAGVGGWEEQVNCFLLEQDEQVVLIDPLVPNDQALVAWLDRRVEGRQVDILLTIYFHLRSADALRRRYAATVWGNAETREEVEDIVTGVIEDGVPLPGGVLPFTPIPNDSDEDETAFWLPRQRALAVGDILINTPVGLRMWWEQQTDAREIEFRDRFQPALRRLLELPIERLLVSHGSVITSQAREALQDALGAPTWQRVEGAT